jgi:hypothetical protein
MTRKFGRRTCSVTDPIFGSSRILRLGGDPRGSRSSRGVHGHDFLRATCLLLQTITLVVGHPKGVQHPDTPEDDAIAPSGVLAFRCRCTWWASGSRCRSADRLAHCRTASRCRPRVLPPSSPTFNPLDNAQPCATARLKDKRGMGILLDPCRCRSKSIAHTGPRMTPSGCLGEVVFKNGRFVYWGTSSCRCRSTERLT